MSANIAHAFDPLSGGAGTPPPPPPEDWRPIMPVPSDAPTVAGPKDADILFQALPRRIQSGGYNFTDAWAYRNEAGAVLGYAVRVDNAAGKEVLPVTFCEGPRGARRYFSKNFPRPRPLFNLLKLKECSALPVLVVEGEKTARAAEKLFPRYWVTTSPSGCKAASMADWGAVKGRDVVIMRDNDEPGVSYAESVARLAYEAGAASVRRVELPAGLPEGWDVADDLPEGVSMADIESAVADALSCPKPTTDAPIPLFQPLPPAEPFPLPTLGPLASVAAAISRQVQVPAAIAAQSVLAAASLAAQAHADVKLPFGQSRPLSLFFVTVAGSGDRKTTADNEALWPVGKHEKNLREANAEDMKTWRVVHAAWAAEKRKIETAKGSFADRKDKLTALGEEPPKPLAPFLKTADLTIDGLTKIWPDAHPALGIFTSEGGVFAGSHSMSDDNRLRTAAMMSELWDGKPITRLRAGDGASILAGRRLAMHVMVQPEAATQFLSDKTLRDQGLLSRMLVSAPPSIAGTRLYREPDPDDQAAIRAYGARLLALLETAPVMAPGKRNELAPRELLISPDAADMWKGFFNSVESQLGAEDGLKGIRDFASKAAEHAARIAAVLTIYEDPRATEVGPHAMGCALEMTDYFIGEAVRLHDAGRTDPKLVTAQRLLEWLQTFGDAPVVFRDIVRLGPSSIRTKDAAEAALTILKAHGWIEEANQRPRSIRLRAEG